jgi:murein DD-endopeptidase MepM/ murein hydrolase activator NlpD
MRPARAAIARRAARGAAAQQGRDIAGGKVLHLSYQRAAQLLDGSPTPEDRRAAFELYRDAEAVEPMFAYDGQPVPQDFVLERESRFALQARLFSIPTQACLFRHAGGKAETEWREDFSGATAVSLVPPLRDYFDPGRDSYGNVQEESDGTFDGLVHVGEDLGWYRDHKTVVAIAAGIVRQVSCQWSWGFMVIIEHSDASGERFCSLYAHLGPYVCVVPGERVSAGQKIGSIGRSFTWENGGYFAHLHFGIHLGWYWQIFRTGALIDVRFKGRQYLGRVLNSDLRSTQLEIHTPGGVRLVHQPTSWICGYLSKPFWRQKRHGWVDPQKFLRGER